MAPKRTSGAKAPPAKIAKTVSPETPVLNFLGKCDEIPKPCREMLQVSLPLCLEVAESDRHQFQVEILDRVTKLLAGVEHTKREAVREAEETLATLNTDKEKATVDHSGKTETAAAKEAECKEKEKVVDAAREVLSDAQQALKSAQKDETDFNAKKAGLFSEQENFNKLVSDVFEPLKNNTYEGNWRERNKQITEIQKKLAALGSQESLQEAIAASLKGKDKGTFAMASINFAEETFSKHKVKVAQDIASLDSEEASLKAATSQQEGVVAEKKAALDVVSKEWDAMQDIWCALDKERAEAAKSESKIESQIPRAAKTVDKANADLEKFLEVPKVFAQLKEKSSAAADEPEPEEEKQGEEEEKAMQVDA